MTTFYPSSQPKLQDWFNLIAIQRRFELDKVNGDCIFGHIIIEGFKLDPDAAIKMMRDQIKDNPEMIKEIIGEWNFKLIA